MSTFEDFWKVYPRRIAKITARTAYDRAVKNGADPARILTGACRYAVDQQGQDPKYTKHPTTWLNGGCWDDEYGIAEPIEITIKPDGAPSDAELRAKYGTSNVVDLRAKSPGIRQENRAQGIPDDKPRNP